MALGPKGQLIYILKHTASMGGYRFVQLICSQIVIVFCAVSADAFFHRGGDLPDLPPPSQNLVLESDDVMVCEGIKFVSVPQGCPRADGDAAQIYLLEKIGVKQACSKYAADATTTRDTLVVDVGGLYGDFGLHSASLGCNTVIFEPQPRFAKYITSSAKLNKDFSSFVNVRNGAVSTEKQLSIVAPPRDRHGREGNPGKTFMETFRPDDGKTLKNIDAHIVNGTALSDAFNAQNTPILFLKVDTEGMEGAVIATASALFANKKVKHLVFEYTPFQFKGRHTNYKTILDDMYRLYGATQCYALDRNEPLIYRIKEEDNAAFHHACFLRKFQTDIYCAFVSAEEDAARFASEVKTWVNPGPLKKDVFQSSRKVKDSS